MAKKFWLILFLVIFSGLSAQNVRISVEEQEVFLRNPNFWRYTMPGDNVMLGIFDTTTSYFQLYLQDTLYRKEKTGCQRKGKTWHKNTISDITLNERIDSVIRITDENIMDSTSRIYFSKYYEQGFDLYCAYGHFIAFEDSVQSFSGRYLGICQHYFAGRLGHQKSSGKLVSELISLDSVFIFEPKQIYTGFFSFYPRRGKTTDTKRYPFFVSEMRAVITKDQKRVLPDLLPISMWKFKEDKLLELPSNILVPPFLWYTGKAMELPPVIKQERPHKP